MDISLFDFDLPEGMIARFPPERREEARLMVIRRGGGALEHLSFSDLPSLFKGNEVLVLNDTRVFPARLLGKKETSGKVEVLLVEQEKGASGDSCRWRVMLGASKPPRPGRRISFEGGLEAEVETAGDGEGVLRFDLTREALLEKTEACGRVPLPPYIKRADEPVDRKRYQTVYAAKTGAIAAPTAGLHFTPEILTALERKGVEIVRLTLHVGPGTFRPVRVSDVREHVMDSEPYEVSEEAARSINRALAEGRPVTAVGTTTTRAMETMGKERGRVEAGNGRAGIYILPGCEFRIVGRLITNFHTPRSTLLMLVSAFAGRERILAAYREAIERGYRFYSYGDAMIIF